MDRYTLPFDINVVDTTSEKISIDMSHTEFDVPLNKQKRAAFIFLRNADIKAELDFTDCSYDDKKEYLLMYLQENIEVDADVLTTTWIEILSARDGGRVTLPSILDADEIGLFVQENNEFIAEIYQLINSLPIYAMYCSQQNGSLFTTRDFKRTDYDRIKMANFYKLAKNDLFILFVDGNTESLFYEKIFIKGEYYICEMMKYLPFTGLLSMFTLDPEIQDDAIERISSLLEPPEFAELSGEEENIND